MEAFHASILDMTLGAEKQQVLLRDVQMHPFRPLVLHVDFQRVDKNKKIHMKVPLHFINAEICPGVKLGGGVVKKRVALPGRGKSGGARTLVATNRDTRWFFVFGFAKNERANIEDRELAALQKLAGDLLGMSLPALARASSDGTLIEICTETAP